jgi:phosphatidylglycerol:prolipoprotein diacylglycerol transferase
VPQRLDTQSAGPASSLRDLGDLRETLATFAGNVLRQAPATTTRVSSRLVTFPTQIAAAWLSGPIRLGPLRLSAFGLCAAAGLLAAFALMRRTAKLAHLDSEQLTDAALFAVMMSFLISRALLIVQDPHAFLSYPLLVLGLPSLTYGGIALTALATLSYLRFKRLPVLAVLDAWAPCAALLAAALAVGHHFEGSNPGMPTTLPWGVRLDASTARLHPVQLYATAASLAIFALLLLLLYRQRRPGLTTGAALAAGGLIAFLLDLLSQPAAGNDAWLEPRQYVALASLVAGVALITSHQESV